MDLNTKIADEYMIPIENLVNPRAIDFHAETNYIYFADTTSFLIGRQKIDGTERETILKDGKWQYVTLTLNCPEIKHFKRINLVFAMYASEKEYGMKRSIFKEDDYSY